jgi:hypothetical protein
MEKLTRAFIAALILMSGVALVPYIELPREELTWQRFAGVYDATLTVNHPTGRPGSIFTFTGSNYPADSVATVTINGVVAGTVETDATGAMTFLVHTINAPLGMYTVTAAVDANATASASFELIDGAPLWPAEGTGPMFFIVPTLFLPVAIHNS